MERFGVSDVDELDGFLQTNKEGTRSYPQTCRIQIFPKRSFFANFRFYILAFGVYPTFGRIVYPYRFCPMDVVGPDNCFCSHNRFPVHPCKKDHFFSWNVSGITWDGREDRFFWKDHGKISVGKWNFADHCTD